MKTQNNLVSVRSLSKDFQRPNGTIFSALEGISLDIFDGEFLAIVGLSGSGKSTLLRCMAGLLKPDRGQVIYSGSFSQNKQFASFVFQNFALFPWLTVRQNVEVSLGKRAKDSSAKAATDNILNLVGLAGFEDSYPRELSGGMRQRVSIARAMVCEPLVLFLDEPFSALDPLTGESLRSEMGRIWTQRDRSIRAVVMVTHSLTEALQLADRVVIMSSNPGAIYKTVEVQLPRPRQTKSKAYLELQEVLEQTFGELHLGPESEPDYEKSSAHQASPTDSALSQPGQTEPMPRVRPLSNTSLSIVEGLLLRLSEEETNGVMDLYDLANEMRLKLDQMLLAVASAEMLSYIDTPGTDLVLTSKGRAYVSEQDSNLRQQMLRESVKLLPLVSTIYDAIDATESKSQERSMVVHQLSVLLPFEDPEEQFEALVNWCRSVNLMTYDPHLERLEISDRP